MISAISSVEDITIEGFQVVSGSMFSQLTRKAEPGCTLWNNSISFNKASVAALNNCERILIRVNTSKKCILLSTAVSTDKDAVSWLRNTKYIQGKKLESKNFASQLYKIWGFDEERVYRTYGKIVTADKKIMLLFNFSEPESWKYRSKGEE